MSTKSNPPPSIEDLPTLQIVENTEMVVDRLQELGRLLPLFDLNATKPSKPCWN